MDSGKEDNVSEPKKEHVNEPEKFCTWIQTQSLRKPLGRENQIKPTQDKMCGSLIKVCQPPVQWKGDDIIQKWSE